MPVRASLLSAAMMAGALLAGACTPAQARLATRARAASSGGVSAPGGAQAGNGAPARGSKPAPSPPKRLRPKPRKRSRPALHGDPARAILTFRAMQKYFYIPGPHLYKGAPYSFLWPFSQALAATISIGMIRGESAKLEAEAHARLSGLQRYWGFSSQGSSGASGEATPAPGGATPAPGEATPAPGEATPAPGEATPASGEATPAGGKTGGSSGEEGGALTEAPEALPSYNGSVILPDGIGNTSYYDDNEWVGIELVRLYQLYHEPAPLESAEQIMAFVIAGWQTNPSLQCPGGVPFSDATDQSRNTVTNAPASELGVLLYKLTHKAKYLSFAEMTYEWVRKCLALPDGLYADHIGIHGKVTPVTWSYNQGTMMGAGTLLYQVTSNGAYLQQARQTATAALAHFTPAVLAGENPFFVSVYFRNLIYLDSVIHDPSGPKLAQAFVNSAWEHSRLSDNVFVFGAPASSQLLYQAAICQIYALLSEPPSGYF
jgi:hypothetical protein